MNPSSLPFSVIILCLTSSLIPSTVHAQDTSSTNEETSNDNETEETNETIAVDESAESEVENPVPTETGEAEQENDTDDTSEQTTTEDSTAEETPETEDEITGEEDDTSEEDTSSQIVINPEEAESLDKTLTKEQLKWLQPTRGKLPQNPYQHVDFTAYTLEWGELQAGLNRSTIGILPRTQIGTQVPLWALGVQNANLKVNALRLGPVDLAITGDYLNLAPTADQSLNIQYYGVGGYGSFRILDNWSIHAGGQYAELNLSGLPNLGALSGPIKTFSGLTDEDIQNVTSAIEEAVKYERSEQILSAKIATDIRLNRRDSFILQGNMMRSETTNSGLSVDADVVQLSLESDQISSPLFQYLLVPQESSVNYGASLAYQASFKRAYLRLGIGYSTIPYAWLLQSIDLTWRWGGQTKRRANELEKIWELNKKLNKEGADSK